MKELSIELLKQLFIEKKYFISIYLWGSILTDEFDTESSDIDAIGIVGDDVPISEKDLLNKTLQTKLARLKINFLYLSELNGGETRESMARFIPIECILYDMPFWLHVAGRKLQKEDFVTGQVSLDKVILSSLEQIRNRFLPVVKPKDQVYFAKAIAKLCYFIHQKIDPAKPFRYHDLIEDATNDTRDACLSIVRMKDASWNIDPIDLSILIRFISEYSSAHAEV